MMETVAGTSPAMSNCSTSSSPSKYITVVDVYDLAESINRDFESLAEQFGKDPIESIVRKVICALETLEALAKNNDRDNAEIMDLQKGIERLQQEKIQRLRDKDTLEKDVSDLEENYKKEIEDLCRAVKSLQAENRSMKRKISTNVADDRGRSVSPEQNDFREQDLQAMLDLRQLQIQQKDQIKDLQRDINTYSCEVDNLQNNIEKLLRQNKELLRKNASLQKQGRILVQERAELLRRLQATEETNFQLRKVLNETSRACKDLESQRQFERENDNSPRFSLCELREVLQEKDVITRWNSTLEMAERLVEQKRAVQIYFSRHDATETRDLTAKEWEMLQQLVLLLEPADSSTRDLCNDDSHLGLQIAISRMLVKEVNEAYVPDLRDLQSLLIEKIRSKFDSLEYQKNYGLAIFLDPRFKDKYFEDGNTFQKLVKQWLMSEYQPVQEATEEEPWGVEAIAEPIAKKPRSLFARQVTMNQENSAPRPTTTWQQNLEYELISYNAEKPVLLESDPVLYWQKNVIRFPILSKAAQRFLSAPHTSQPSEQLFSHARDIFHYKRSQLDPYNAEQLIFLNRALIDINFTY